MALRKAPLALFVRSIPFLLVITLCVFWNSEKNLRISLEQKVQDTLARLMQSEDKIQAMTRELEQVRIREANALALAQQVQSDKNYLIEQLGKRDEHIRKLLAETIGLLAGENNINLGKISVTNKEKWAGVQSELNQLVTAPPIVMPVGTRQTMVEQYAVPAQPMVLTSAGMPSASAGSTPVDYSRPVREISGAGAGKVIVINNEHDFVVIDLGKNNGVDNGTKFDIVRNGKVVGSARVETAYQKISAASVLSGDVSKLQKGDTVRLN